MELNTTATFIGHSECYGVTKEQVKVAIVELIEKGVTDFLSGGQGGFDRMCAGCVKELQEEYPHISNILVIPYLDFNVLNKDIFDLILYPEGFEKYHYKAAIPARNKYMVNNSGYAICYQLLHPLNNGEFRQEYKYLRLHGFHKLHLQVRQSHK